MKDYDLNARRWQLTAPNSAHHLAIWIDTQLGMKMPLQAVCPNHQSPLDYLAHSFLEEDPVTVDAVVWACRGGGKTMLGAIATLLDLLFKPGIEVRILGGSLEQSEKMYAYLRTLVETRFARELAGGPTQRRIVLRNGSRAEVLAQSHRSVRGQRVQKPRCDEVELFEPAVWQAAQLTTRSMEPGVRGAVEAFSTMHLPGGLMQQIVLGGQGASPTKRKLFTWCIWDVMEKCPADRRCEECPLWASCQGRAKGAAGFVPVEDVIAMQSRVSQFTWNHEMLCLPPKLERAVFPTFSPEVHVRAIGAGVLAGGASVSLDGRRFHVEQMVCGVDFGYAHPFVCLWIAMLREHDRRVVWVVDELVNTNQTIMRNSEEMRRRGWSPAIVYCDVAGKQINRQTALSDERVMRDAGFATRCRFMKIDPGVGMVRDLVDPAVGPPRFFIDPRCGKLIAAMQGYGASATGAPLKDGRHDHLIDALRYALVNHDEKGAKVVQRLY